MPNSKKDIFSIGDPDNENISRRDYRIAWVENSFTPEQESKNYLSSNFDKKKLRWLFFGIFFIFLVMLFRVGYLQIARGEEYRTAAEDNRIRIQAIKAPRGIITDRNGNVLAHNVPNFLLTFTPADLPEDNIERVTLIDRLAEILEINRDDIAQIINEQPGQSFQSYLLQEHIAYEKAILLRIVSQELPGISLQIDTFREYNADFTFSHVLGYTSKISEEELADNPDYLYDAKIGKAGIELYYEDLLRGVNGKKEIEVNSLGKESSIVSEKKPETGKNLTLTIDQSLQQVLGQAIEDTVQSSKSITGAAAIAIDPNNGEILALVSSPVFDNNLFNLGLTIEEYQNLISDPKKPLFNRAISGEYPSGSTIKPLISLAALAEGIVTPQTTILSTGGIQIDRWFFPDWKAGGHGTTNLTKAIAESVNSYFYLIGGGDEEFNGLGVEKIRTYLELFGLNGKIGIDLAGESAGFLPSKQWKEESKEEKWYIGDTYHLSIGQGDLLVTPLQVASYTATIANGGTFYLPHLVKAITNTQKNTTIEVLPTIIRNNFIEKKHFTAVQNGLREAVISGSAVALGDLPVTSAGKTGTAQFGNKGQTHAWFTSYAPYENPEIAITVLIEGGGEGYATALPIAKKGYLQWFQTGLVDNPLDVETEKN
ncbi:penicillin-binding protein 2 [Patescibacteria group bacterium]|nr:penicillin-binding protein 2 [Patescibacteria group bacterium]